MTIQIEYVPITALGFYERNARTHSDVQVDQLVASIQEFGFTNPVLIDENNILIAGHGRTTAAKLLGITDVPAIRLRGLTENQIKALRIADNQLALNAGWDLELLSAELQELETDGFELDLMGFDSSFLDELLDGTYMEENASNEAEPEEPAPQPPEDPVTVPGDLWLLGRHRVLCGDSTSIDAVEKLTDGQLADLLITDPPYNVAYEGGTADALTIMNDNMADQEFRQFLRDVYSAADAVMKPGAVFYIWHADSEGYNFRGAAYDIGWQVRQCLVWAKNSLVLGRQDYHWQHEPCLYGWKAGAAHYWGSDRSQTTLLEFSRPTRNAEHPTMKPVDLIEYQIKNSSKRSDLVLDLFGGSGTTLIACEKTGRTCAMMELDPKYADVIVKRWQNQTGQQAVHADLNLTFNQIESMRGGESYESTKHMVITGSAEVANDAEYNQKKQA